jgi:hypothetical protein
MFQANLEGKKLMYFSDRIEENSEPLTPVEFETIIEG